MFFSCMEVMKSFEVSLVCIASTSTSLHPSQHLSKVQCTTCPCIASLNFNFTTWHATLAELIARYWSSLHNTGAHCTILDIIFCFDGRFCFDPLSCFDGHRLCFGRRRRSSLMLRQSLLVLRRSLLVLLRSSLVLPRSSFTLQRSSSSRTVEARARTVNA